MINQCQISTVIQNALTQSTDTTKAATLNFVTLTGTLALNNTPLEIMEHLALLRDDNPPFNITVAESHYVESQLERDGNSGCSYEKLSNVNLTQANALFQDCSLECTSTEMVILGNDW